MWCSQATPGSMCACSLYFGLDPYYMCIFILATVPALAQYGCEVRGEFRPV